MKILANPVLLRAAVVFFCATFSFLLGLIMVRLLRKSITEEANISSEASPSLEVMPMHVYNTVIAQLKQQRSDLQAQSQADQQRARLNEAVAQAVLSNLTTGVLVFGPNGLVKTSNAAAKEILGFAVTTGMGVDDIFRGAVLPETKSDARDESTSEHLWLADEIRTVLHEGGTRRQVHVEYETPSGINRDLCLTISAVPAAEGGTCGVACLVEDATELCQLRQQQSKAGASAGV